MEGLYTRLRARLAVRIALGSFERIEAQIHVALRLADSKHLHIISTGLIVNCRKTRKR